MWVLLKPKCWKTTKMLVGIRRGRDVWMGVLRVNQIDNRTAEDGSPENARSGIAAAAGERHDD